MEGIRYYFANVNENIQIKKCNNSIHASKAHFHNEVSIGLVENGHSKTEIYDNIYEITNKTFLIIPPSIVHKCNPYDLKKWKFRMLYINKEWFHSAFNMESEKIKFSFMNVNKIMYSRIVRLFDNIENNLIDIENESKLLYYISLLISSNNNNYIQENYEVINSDKMNKIKEFLDENFLNNVMLNDLVKVSGISKYYLIRQFESCYGLSPHKYATNLRINHAKKLLKSNRDFADIALESGFYDQSHFTKCFKEYTGVTPKKYKSYA